MKLTHISVYVTLTTPYLRYVEILGNYLTWKYIAL